MSVVYQAEVISKSMELKVTATADSPMVVVSVIELRHSNRRAQGSAKLVSVRHFTRAEWEYDALSCIEDELAALLGPSLGVE